MLFPRDIDQRINVSHGDTPKDDSDIYRFPTLHMAETHFLFENPSISESSLGKLEKFLCSSGLPILKYNCVVIFFRQMFWLFIYAAKYIFT